MGVRATCTHVTSESNDTIRVDLIVQSYSGASREVIGAGKSWMRFSHDQLDYANIFNTVVQRGRLEFKFHVQSDDDRNVINDILSSVQGEYNLAYYRNGSLQWIGEVMMDQLGSLSAGEPYPFVASLVARDFITLDGQLFPLEDNRQIVTTVLGRLLDATGYDLPIHTHTSWTTTGTTEANDFLRQVYVDTRNLRDFNKEGDIQITFLEALTRLVAPFKAVLRQANGVFILDQLSAYETPTSVLRTIYDKVGAFQSQSNIDTTISANATVSVVSGSVDEIKPGYKRASITYNHRTPQGDIRFPERIILDPAGTTTFVESEFIQQDKVLTLTGRASVAYTNGAIVDSFRPSALVEIKHVSGSGTFYWNDALNVWQSGQLFNAFEMKASDDRFGGNTAQSGFNTRVNIETIPTVVSGELTITLLASPVPSGRISFTAYADFEFIVVEEDEDKATTALRYVAEQSLAFTQNYDGGVYYFGDGPTVRSSAALRTSTTTTALTTSWTRRGDAEDLEFHEIALREIMDHYRGYGRIGSYTIKGGDYIPTKILVYDTRGLYYVGGSFDGYTGWWSPIVFELDLIVATDQLVVGFVSGPSLITSTTLTAVSLSQNNSIEANANYIFRLATQVSGTVTQLVLVPENVDYPLLRKDMTIRVVHPVTLEQHSFTLSQDMIAGSLTIPVVSLSLTNPLPAGSYVYTNAGDGTAALIIGRDSIKLTAESNSIGVTTTESLGSVTSLQAVMNTRVQAGDDLFVINSTNGTKRAFTVNETVGPGLVTLQLNQATVFDAPAGSYIIGSTAQFEGFLQVTPAGVLAKATASTVQNSFAVLSAPLPSGVSTNSIPVTSVRTLRLLDESQIGVQDRAGNTEFFEVDGQQDLTGATTTIAVVSKAPSVSVGAGAGVFQPMWNQTAILSVQAFEISQRVTGSEVQTLISENLDGQLPALSLPFESSDEGFTPTTATLTTTATHLEFLATGAGAFMTKTTSYVAGDNPIVTLRVQRVAGTNWGGAFGWSTDGTNFTTQNFIEPDGLDDDFQFTTIDLTSNGSYTGTITAIRIYLGEANLDEYKIDSLTVGKFNPQTQILADLSSRLTVAEAGLLNTSTEFTTYTQNGVLLNGSAKVAVIRNATTTYTTVVLTDTRGGFTVRDNQDYYLVNADGTFQAVKIDGNQTVTNVTTPTTFTLDIQSVNFATTIEVGAVLYESAFTQSTRISQSAGEIVLKASETDGEVTSLALVRLDGSVASGSAVTIQGDLVAINDIEIVRGVGASAGLIRSNNFVSGSTGWRIQGTGNAEFNDVTVRGSVFVTGGDAATESYADGVADTALTDALEALSVTIRSTTQPTTRPNGDALRIGDVWIDTDDGDAPYSYNGSIFIAAYTSISGGSIKTGTIRADLVAIQNADSDPDVVINNTGITFKQIDAGNDTEIKRSIHWINDDNLTGQSRIVSYAGGSNIAVDVAGTDNTKDMRFSVRRDIDGNQDLSIGIVGIAGSFVTGSAVGDAVVSVSNGILWLNDAVRATSSLTANSLIVGTQTNKATISYTTNAARTFTLSGNSGTILTTANYTGTLDNRYARKVSAGSTVSPDTGIEITFGDGTTYIINGFQI